MGNTTAWLEDIVNGSMGSIFTSEEMKALTYQYQGSYDNKPVEILSKDLYHRKVCTNTAKISFFDSQVADDTISNVVGSQLPASESFTVHELLLRFIFNPAVQPSDVTAQAQAALIALQKSVISVGVKNKTPWIQLQGSRLVAGFSGFQNILQAAANTTPVALGNCSTVDLSYTLAIPKVIGEKVNFEASIQFASALGAANILVTNNVEIFLALGGIDVRAR